MVDGKHIHMNPPPNSGSTHFNYKGYFRIVMMAVINANYEFIYVDVGKNGRVSDGGSLKDTTFHRKMMQKTLCLPSRQANKHGLNIVFVADKAFALNKLLMKPFPVRTLNRNRSVYNYHVQGREWRTRLAS